MTRALLVLLALAIIARVTLAEQLPPPRNPAGNEPETLRGPSLAAPQDAQQLPPQNALQQPPAPRLPLGPQAAPKKPGQPPDLFAARRQAEKDRKQARIDRMNQFKAARAAEQQKLYQDWHERYLADTPVRVEYYRAQAAAYQSQAAIPYYSPPYFYGAGPPVILPPVYAPIVATPIYYGPVTNGTFFSWGW
jgi:hypothetical protein